MSLKENFDKEPDGKDGQTPRKRAYVFDLDCTFFDTRPLYPAMRENAARLLMKHTTMNVADALDTVDRVLAENNGYVREGFAREFGIHPHETVDTVYDPTDMELTSVKFPPGFRDLIKSLDGPVYIYTNASTPYADKLLATNGFLSVVEDVYGVDRLDYHRKPSDGSFRAFEDATGLDDTYEIVFFEDSLENLYHAKQRGWTTVLVNGYSQGNMHANADMATWEYVDRMVCDIAEFFDPNIKPKWTVPHDYIYR